MTEWFDHVSCNIFCQCLLLLFYFCFFSHACIFMDVCISRPPAFGLAPGPCPCLPNCIHQPWAPIYIYQPWPTILLPVRSLSLHILTLSPEFVFVFMALAYNLYYRSETWICIYLIIGSSSSGSSNFFVINNANICMPILVN